MNWIEVWNTLPNVGQRVLAIDVFSAAPLIDLYTFKGTEGRDSVWVTETLFKDTGITHWMPLPKPPNEKGN